MLITVPTKIFGNILFLFVKTVQFQITFQKTIKKTIEKTNGMPLGKDVFVEWEYVCLCVSANVNGPKYEAVMLDDWRTAKVEIYKILLKWTLLLRWQNANFLHGLVEGKLYWIWFR